MADSEDNPLLREELIKAVVSILDNDNASVPPRLIATAILTTVYNTFINLDEEEPAPEPVTHKPFYVGDNTVSIDLWKRAKGRIASAPGEGPKVGS